MNKRTRDKLYPVLVERQKGEYCKICGRPGTKDTLYIEHLDNNNTNNELSNLRLAHQSCNISKNPRGKGKKKISPVCESVCEINIESTKSAAQARNDESEPIFRKWLYEYVHEKKEISVFDAVNGGAEIARCSQMAVRRYLDKLTSIMGDYQVLPGDSDKLRFVRFKDEVDPVKLKEKGKAEALKALEEKYSGGSEKVKEKSEMENHKQKGAA